MGTFITITHAFLKLKSDRLTRVFNLSSISFFALGLFGYALRSNDYFSAVPGDFGDDRFNSVILEHLFRWVTGHEAALWSPPFFFPFEHVLAFSDNHFGSAIFYIVLRFLGLSREIAFDGWFLIGITLSFFCTCLAFRQVGFSKLASAVGAFVFCFSLPVLHLEIHAQLIYRFATPLAFVAFWNLLITRRLFLFWQVVFWGTIQFFCAIYLGVFLFYLLSATLLAWLIVAEKKKYISALVSSFQREKRSAKIFFCSAIVTSIAGLAWLMYKYYAVTLEYPLGPPQGQLAAFLPQLSRYFSMDTIMFFGFGVWILCIFGVAKTFQKDFRNKIGVIMIITFTLLLAVTLSVKGHSLYLLFAHLPGISAIRIVERIVLVMLLPIGILVAIGVEALQQKASNASVAVKILLLIVLCSLLGGEVIAYQPKNTSIHEWQVRKISLLKKLPAQLPSRPILYVTIKKGEPWYTAELDGMILAQDLGIPTINGYSGNKPPGYSAAHPCSSYLYRLQGHAVYRKLPLSTIGPLAQRVVSITPTPCRQGPDVGFSVLSSP